MAGIRIYSNLIVPSCVYILLEPAARQCDQSTQQALNNTSRCATWPHGCHPHHINHNILTEKERNHLKQDLDRILFLRSCVVQLEFQLTCFARIGVLVVDIEV